ncbi:MAG: hypothetical protein QOF48_2508 [Verrucomicrobiota bacterium]|jgi:hypothetical protein
MQRALSKSSPLLPGWIGFVLLCWTPIATRSAPPATNHWAFQPLTRPAPPPVRPSAWPRTPIDTFILAALEKQGLAPSPPADKATLLRRVTFDLHGLPPTPSELDEFLADRSADAFAKTVERLLESPRYGERWGRHWLDVARFSESDGYEYDKMREHAWPYRDYVIRALNDDKPYARFVAEQIAGDVLEPLTREGIAATGFLVAGPYDEAGNSSVSTLLKARIREEEMEDIVAAVSQTFLGVTVNCARCHDHKFDPIPQTDYYRLKAALDGVRHGNRPFAVRGETRVRDERAAELNGMIKETDAQLAALDSAARARVLAARDSQATAAPATNQTVTIPKPMARWTFDKNANDLVGGLHGHLLGGAELSGGHLKLNGRGAYVRTDPLERELREKTLEAWVSLENLEQRGGGVFSVESREDASFDAIVFGERTPRRWIAGSSSFERTKDIDAPDEASPPGEFIHFAAVYHSNDQIALFRNGAAYGSYTPSGPGSALRTFAAGSTRILFGLRHTGAANGFLAGEIDEARLYDRALTPQELSASAQSRQSTLVTPGELARAFNADERERRDRLATARSELRAQLQTEADRPLVHAVVTREPEPTYVLARGDVEMKGAATTAGALSVVRSLNYDFALAADAPEAQRRQRLAEWLASTNNPLTWRVIVNRVWHHHFGRGLAATPNDFGVNGERPSHPELLDWLASEFLAQGGSLKNLHRLILSSAVYQQASASPLEKENPREVGRATATMPHPSRDADNRLLAHFPLRRLEAEAVRDAMLSVSGQLNLRMAGPGFRPFKITISNSHFYELIDSPEPEFNRRSIYRAGVQSAKDPLLDSLDCPDPSTKTPARGITTTPLQALSLMNNAFVQRQARHFAERLKSHGNTNPDAQVQQAWRLAFGRAPRSDEARDGFALVRQHGLDSLCWTLLNSSEFIYVK